MCTCPVPAERTQTLKFDNLCHNFYQHEWLDGSGAVLTATKDPLGTITGMALTTTSDNGAPIPLTVPSASASAVSRCDTRGGNRYTLYKSSPEKCHTEGSVFCVCQNARTQNAECTLFGGLGTSDAVLSVRWQVHISQIHHNFFRVALQILASFGTTLSPSTTETYGADTTFTFAAGTLNTGDLSKPALSE